MNKIESKTDNYVSNTIFFIVIGFLFSAVVVLLFVYLFLKKANATKSSLDIAAESSSRATSEILNLVERYKSIAPSIEKIIENENEFRSTICTTLKYIDLLTPSTVNGREIIRLDLSKCT